MDEWLADRVDAEARERVRGHRGRTGPAPVLLVGQPGEEVLAVPDPPPAAGTGPTQPSPDAGPGLRTDLVARALDGLTTTEGAVVLLCRGGDAEPGDLDLAWWSAARSAFARHGMSLPAFVVVTRHSWTDLVTGTSRPVPRARPRRHAPPPAPPWDDPTP